MIVDLIVTLLLGMLNAVLGLIPEFEIFEPASSPTDGGVWSHGEQTAGSAIAGWLALWDLFFPIALFFQCLLAVLAARAFVALVQFVQWVWRVLPFKST